MNNSIINPNDSVKFTHKGILHIADVEIPCFVLEDGRRVISGRELTPAIGMQGRGKGVNRLLTHPSISPFVTSELREALENPIYIKSTLRLYGYEATVLLQVCEAILTARDEGLLRTEQELRYAKACDTLVRSFAKVGIIALVDEATGYQAERDRNELQKILAAYISPELLPWTKRFPDEFYEQMFRLWGWNYRPLNTKKTQYVGKLTNQLVYDKLPKGVLEELRKKNPTNETGRRKHKHHQFLTDNIGNPHLEKHLAIIITLMRISPNKTVFLRSLQRAFPEPVTGTQLTMEVESEETE